MTMPAQIRQIADRIDAMSLRERALTFLVVMGAIYFVAMSVLFTPLRAEHSRATAALKTKNEQIDAMNQEMQILAGGGDSGDQRLTALREELKQLDADLAKVAGGMVSPQQMAKYLEQVLARHAGIKLVKIETLPKDLAFDSAAAGEKLAGAVVYRHGVRLRVRGGYFDLVNYLKALEALPWTAYWGEVALDASAHPASELTLVVYTLSRHAGWIGV